VFSYLIKTAGARIGAQYKLNPEKPTFIGRGLECDIVLTDPLCSREHAVIYWDEDAWWLQDEKSRNGTQVNGQKAGLVQLDSGAVVQVGSAEFRLELSESPPKKRADLSQTIIRDASMAASESHEIGVDALLRNPGTMTDFLDLYHLSLNLLACRDPDGVTQTSLEVLRTRTKASFVGFLWVADDGTLRPKLVIPEKQAKDFELSDSLTSIVTDQRHAVWVKNETNDASASLREFADAICVPLLRDEKLLGAIHLYLEQGSFSQGEFDFAVSVSNMVAAALVSAREQATLTAEHQRLMNSTASANELIGESKPMIDLKSRISRIAQATGCVLIRGESGAGKELVARAVHREGSRADRPMLCVNCAAIPRELMESQLFGHKKGSFTGADKDHVGWFEQADAGTLLLDEVGEMTLDGQAKLLRIMEGHPFLPVGGSKEVVVDVRIIAATNRDLGDFVREGKFREDLYYRMSVFELYIPPLRDRGEDIERLVNHFLEHFKHQHGRRSLVLGDSAREKLLSYNWPGNVRQLRNVMDSAVVMALGDELRPADFGLRDVGGGQGLDTLNIDEWEKKLIKEAISRTNNSVPEAAKLLGIGRATLYRKIEEYGIER